MTDHDLENLNALPVPPPSAAAKRAAMAAALEAFDGREKDFAAETQENVVPLRRTDTSKQRSFLMRLTSRSNMAIAASLAALAIAAPLTFRHIEEPKLAKVSHPLPPADTQRPASPQKPSQPEADAVERRAKAATPVAPPLSVDRQDLAQKGADPAQPATAPANKPAAAPPAHMSYLGKKDKEAAALNGLIDDARSRRVAEPSIVYQTLPEHRDQFEAKEANPIKQVVAEPVSTFSLDVDTASYSFVRRALMAGNLPPKDAVRVEEMINYFPYAYPAPETADAPFTPTITVLPSPWNSHNKLVHVGIKGYALNSAERPRANLVFLVDVSGSMQPADRLPLVQASLRMLVDQMKPDDTIGIVTYASGSGIALEPTKVSDRNKILSAIDKLSAGGSTAGAEGLQDAYRLAENNFEKSAVNRIVLATDGDFNVGITDRDELKSFIERKRASGIYLSILGVGQGNHNDALMQALAQNGNGTATYVDTLNEARKVLVEESTSTLFPIAKDVKVQIEWNPQRVSDYRLIGYETRALKREDFNNDKVDAGDVGSGHTVTAIYEITPVGAPAAVDDLRYSKAPAAAAQATDTVQPAASAELGFLKLRYKRPKEDQSQLISQPITDANAKAKIAEASSDVRFSTAVAGFGQLLRGSEYLHGFGYDDVLALAQGARGDDPFGYRAEFLNLVRLAKSARP